jgi:metallo-beta-lactamase family protein
LAIFLSFHGAAGSVTGSKYLISVKNERVLVDCGMFQGPRELRLRNWNPPPFDPKKLDAVILTHGHIDHIGYLPRIVKQGFAGKVYATPPTIDISYISLLDTAHLQEEDADYRNRNKLTRHEKALPLFGKEDVEETMRLFLSADYNEWVPVSDSIRFRYHDAGHILGAAGVELEMDDDSRKVSLFFSGDVGRYGNFLTNNPSVPPACDYLVCESTYGGRIHEPEDPGFQFGKLINEVVEEKGILLVPAFAVTRTQQIIYLVNHLIKYKQIPYIDIHVDSPMAIAATEIYKKYRNYHQTQLDEPDEIALLQSSNIHFYKERNESKRLNRLKGPGIIISASGMLSGGRILHHMINRLPSTNATVVLVGFMAEGTLGRKLLDGDRELYIHKTLVQVRARIVTIMALSGHADFYELLHWLEPIKTKPKKVFVTHGEPEQAAAMAEHLRNERGWDCLIPTLDQTVEL